MNAGNIKVSFVVRDEFGHARTWNPIFQGKDAIKVMAQAPRVGDLFTWNTEPSPDQCSPKTGIVEEVEWWDARELQWRKL